MLKLSLFGTPSVDAGGDPLQGRATQRRRLALLALLATTPGQSLSRDKLVGLLWPEHDQERARHLLAVSLYELRKSLGEDALVSRGDDVVLSRARLSIDVIEFDEALRQGDIQHAIALYSGPFLDGFHISDAPEFEHWMEARRVEYQRRFDTALEELADARTREGDLHGAVEAWHRLAASDAYSTRFTLGYMRALEQAGDHARALLHARVHESLLKAEFDAEPDPAVTDLAERIRNAPHTVDTSQSDAEANGAAPGSDAAGHAADDDAESIGVEPTAVSPPSAAAVVDDDGGEHPLLLADASGSERVTVRVSASAGRRAGGRRRRVVAAVVLAFAAGIAIPASWQPREAEPLLGHASLAVMPFAPMSAEADDDEYFRDGLTDDIINALGRADAVKVIARSSTFLFKGRTVDVRDVGSQLGVATVLEGSAWRRGDDVRLAVNLVNASDRSVIWSEDYDVAFASLFAAQEEIVRRIVEELGGRPPTDASPALVEAQTEDLDAYQYYIRGRSHWEKRTPTDLALALTHFERAVEADTAYVLALAGLSDVYNTLAAVEYGLRSPAEAYARAEAAALRALRLDSTNANAHAALANVRLNRRDWESAIRGFRRALELNPGYAQARHWYSLTLLAAGHPDEALKQIQRARELDVLSVTLSASLGRHYYLVRDFDQAVHELRYALELDPTSLIAMIALGMALAQQGDLDGAIAAFSRADQMAGGKYLLASAFLGHALAKVGRRRDALAALDKITAASADRFVPPEYAMIVHLGLGDHEKALDALEEAAKLGSGSLIYLDLEPLLDPLRTNPRFIDLLRTVKGKPSSAGVR